MLKTKANGLTFERSKSAFINDPCITIIDDGFRVCQYSLETLKELAEQNKGLCITRGKFEKYRSIDAATIQNIINEY